MTTNSSTTPLTVNVISSLLQSQGFYINPTAASYVGTSANNATYTSGAIVNDTCLFWLTNAINVAYQNLGNNVSTTTYDNLISIGAQSIPALGNSKPPTYIIDDPSGNWQGQANTGFGISGNTDHGQDATWVPYLSENPNVGVTQWGFIRLLALQAYNEFYYNAAADNDTKIVTATNPSYKDFLTTFYSCYGYTQTNNTIIYPIQNSLTFQDGTFSNQNDSITADLTGVSLSLQDFGQDLINLGLALNINRIDSFGLPSTLLQLLSQNKALTQDVNLALLSVGLSANEINDIANQTVVATTDQEQKIYAAFLIITGSTLSQILVTLSCKTKGITSLADLLNVKKLFPISYTTLTVPIYNTTPGLPTNSKTYYLLFIDEQLNPQLTSAPVAAQIPPVTPPLPPSTPVPVATPVPVPVTSSTVAASAITTDGGVSGQGFSLKTFSGQVYNVSQS